MPISRALLRSVRFASRSATARRRVTLSKQKCSKGENALSGTRLALNCVAGQAGTARAGRHTENQRDAVNTEQQWPLSLDRGSDSLYKQIVELLREQILNGTLKEGDVLPSERELAMRFDVSRVPVREALKILEYLGVVRHVRGKGVFVQRADLGEFLSTVGPMMMEAPNVLSDLFDIRLILETHAASLAARFCTEQDLELMEKELLEMDEGIRSGQHVEEASLDFHSSILTASHNQVLQMVNLFLGELQRHSRRRSLWSRERQEEALHYHQSIFARIRARDPEGAYNAMREHLLQGRRQVENRDGHEFEQEEIPSPCQT